MITISKKGEVVHPYGIITGLKDDLPITSVSCSFGVGVMPICRVGVPPESLNGLAEVQTDDLLTIQVGNGSPDHVLFKGYLAGENGMVGGSEIEAGITLIHPARDIDEMRISAPDLHPASVNDFNYTFFGEGINKNGNQAMFAENGYFEAGGDPLAKQIISGLIANLEFSKTKKAEGFGFKIQAADKAIALLKMISPKQGILESSMAETLRGTINTWVRNSAIGSFTSMRSVWDTLTSIFSYFGLLLVCDNNGVVDVLADCAGMTAPRSNYLGPDYITGFNLNTSLTRNIKEVNLLCDHARPSKITGVTIPATLITYPQPEEQKEGGASMSIMLPGWLNPIAFLDDKEASVRAAQLAYAKSQFYVERSKFRTVAVSGPLAPKVVPGTTALITPYSSIKTFSSDGVETLQKTYTGYCYQVNHTMDAKTKVLQTTFYFRNVSDSATGETIDAHPIFGDVQPAIWN